MSRVLREAPRVSVLATSREPLAVQGEHVWSVEPLSTAGGDDAIDPDPTGIPAVALFVERARAADPSFVLDETTRPSSWRYAGGSTASHSRSSSRRRGHARSESRRSPAGWTSASDC